VLERESDRLLGSKPTSCKLSESSLPASSEQVDEQGKVKTPPVLRTSGGFSLLVELLAEGRTDLYNPIHLFRGNLFKRLKKPRMRDPGPDVRPAIGLMLLLDKRFTFFFV
jgi:hypothetical protein